jgi:hypothetical protein
MPLQVIKSDVLCLLMLISYKSQKSSWSLVLLYRLLGLSKNVVTVRQVSKTDTQLSYIRVEIHTHTEI